MNQPQNIEKHSFEEYLKSIHAETYTGTDDDMPDAFENWLEHHSLNEIIEYADTYGAQQKQESIRMLLEHVDDETRLDLESYSFIKQLLTPHTDTSSNHKET